ncbi:MAG: DUF488 domain-containing protein [Burkholderiaceae bacterium]|jgi:uncharacterized protein (DUF488 family)|nr:DUF488 domain-containing protein [Burkholderiaceae bacterium]MCO5103576.1 DUF488 domain-containing protein [Burkholderiaceae bacterium]
MHTPAESLPPVFTIGHSTHSFDAFAALLEQENVERIVDVRKLTGSRRFPQFNADALSPALQDRGIGYQHIVQLGGRRGRTLAKGEHSPNGYWTNDSFRRYADYALTDDFAAGMAQLRAASQDTRCALMCAEAVWWRCHRRIITDYLLQEGREVRHILGKASAEPASMTPGAEPAVLPGPPPRTVLLYPPGPEK